MTRVLRILWLTMIWLILWSDISWANVLSGLLLAVAITVSFDGWRDGQVVIRPIAIAKFAGYFLYLLITSTLVLIRTVVSPNYRIRRAIVAVPMLGCSDALVTLVADAISLTPGTLTLEVRRDPLTLYVHALDVRDISVLQREVRTLELLAVNAFGDQETIAGIAVDHNSVWGSR